MTIDKDAFGAGMGLLAGNFNRTADEAVMRAYYLVLSPRLSTEEFTEAVHRCISEDQYWPPAATILDKVGRLQADRGALAFEHVNRIMGLNGGYKFLPHAVFQAEFDAPTRAAISAVGGLSVIGNTTEERWSGLARRFATAYRDAVNAPPAIASGGTDGRVLQLVRSTTAALTSGRDRAVRDDA